MEENTISEVALGNQEEKLDFSEGILKSHVLYYVETLFNSFEVVQAFNNRNSKVIDITKTKAINVETFSENKLKGSMVKGYRKEDADRYFGIINDKMRSDLEKQLSNAENLKSNVIIETLDICSAYLKESLDWFIKDKIKAKKSKTYKYPDKKAES